MPFDAHPDEADHVLLRRFASGDAVAARVLTLRLTPMVFAHALRLLGNRAEAEDVAQEALLRLWRIAPDWREGEAKVSTWLYRVTANLATDQLRKRRSVALDSVPEPEDSAPSAAEGLQDAARNNALLAALADLPERQRQAVVLRHIEGLGNPEIAGIMDISAEAVESLIARGKRALTQALAGRRADLGYQND